MWFADLSDVRWEVKGYVGVAAVVLVVIWLASVIKWRAQNVNLHSPLHPSPLLEGCSPCLPWDGCFKPPLSWWKCCRPSRTLGFGAVCVARHLPVQRRAARMGLASICTSFVEAHWIDWAGLVGLGGIRGVASAFVVHCSWPNQRLQPWTGTELEPRNACAMAQAQGCTAILPLPYFHKGSEMWDTPADEGLAATTMTASFHLGLPTMASIMSRTSVSETVDNCRFGRLFL